MIYYQNLCTGHRRACIFILITAHQLAVMVVFKLKLFLVGCVELYQFFSFNFVPNYGFYYDAFHVVTFIVVCVELNHTYKPHMVQNWYKSKHPTMKLFNLETTIQVVQQKEMKGWVNSRNSRLKVDFILCSTQELTCCHKYVT